MRSRSNVQVVRRRIRRHSAAEVAAAKEQLREMVEVRRAANPALSQHLAYRVVHASELGRYLVRIAQAGTSPSKPIEE